MLVVPASVVSQCQLTPKSIVASILVSCPRHGKRRLVLCNADGSLQTTDTLNDVELVSAEHLFLQFIHLPSSAIAHSEACYTLLARTSVGAVALGTSNCHSSEFQWQNVYQDDELIWIETSATGFYGIHKDRSTISFDFISSVRDTTLYLPLKRTRAAPPITTTMNGSITQSLATYFSLPSEDGLWMGHDDGTVTFRCFQDGRQRDALVTLIPNESIKYIFAARQAGSAEAIGITVIGSEGSIQTYIAPDKHDPAMVVFREFHLSGPIRTAAQVNSVSFLISLGSEARLYHVAIPAEVSEQRDLIVIPIAEIMDVSLLYIFYHRSQDIRAYIMQNASILNAFRIDLDQVAEDNADPWILKNQVDRVLSQVKAEERLQRQLDEKQDRMNTDIVALNRVVYLLQRAKSLGKRLFQCEIGPRVVPSSMRTLMQGFDCFLHIRLQTECVLDNEAWSVQVDLHHNDDLLEESSSRASGRTRHVTGKTFLLSLCGPVNTGQTWEWNISLNTETMRFPLMVSLYLVNATNTDTGGNTGCNQPPFPISDMILDDLHFVTGLTSDVTTGFEQTSRQNRRESGIDASESKRRLGEGVGAETASLLNMIQDYTLARIPFRVKLGVRSAEEVYQCILLDILKEGRTREDLKQLFRDNQTACFTLPRHPNCPVTLKLHKGLQHASLASSLDLMIHIESRNAILVLKVEAALMLRLYEWEFQGKYHEKLLKKQKASAEVLQLLEDMHAYKNPNGPELRKMMRAWKKFHDITY